MSGSHGLIADPDAAYERYSRARVYTWVASVAALLTLWYMFHNVFLAPVVATIGALCSWRGLKNGGQRRLLLTLMVICLIPALIAAVALLALLPNLPSLKLSGIHYVRT
jgi:hypothetical protein